MRPEAAMRGRAETQLGIVTRAQCLACGLTDRQIRHLRTRGLLVTVHRGVYRTGGSAPSFQQDAIAACLACGKGAFCSFTTAGAIWEITAATHPIVVTVTSDRRPRVPGVEIHRSTMIGARDRTHRGPVPVSTVPRTLLDLAAILEPPALEQTLDEALRRRLTTPDRLIRYLARPCYRSSAGIGLLRELAKDRAGEGVPESSLETMMLTLVSEYRLPAPVRQHEAVIGGRRVRFDLAYPDANVAIELDGRGPHFGRDRWQSDHDRHNATELGGWLTLRFTWWDVTERPLLVVLTIAEALSIRPSSWRSARRSKASGRSCR